MWRYMCKSKADILNIIKEKIHILSMEAGGTLVARTGCIRGYPVPGEDKIQRIPLLWLCHQYRVQGQRGLLD